MKEVNENIEDKMKQNVRWVKREDDIIAQHNKEASDLKDYRKLPRKAS